MSRSEQNSNLWCLTKVSHSLGFRNQLISRDLTVLRDLSSCPRWILDRRRKGRFHLFSQVRRGMHAPNLIVTMMILGNFVCVCVCECSCGSSWAWWWHRNGSPHSSEAHSLGTSFTTSRTISSTSERHFQIICSKWRFEMLPKLRVLNENRSAISWCKTFHTTE